MSLTAFPAFTHNGNGSQKDSQRGSQKESLGSQKGSHLGQVSLVFNDLLN